LITLEQVKKLSKLSAGDLAKHGLTKAGLKKLEITLDPIKWSTTYLRNPENPKYPFVPRSMQAEILALNNPKISVRASRRSGKSVAMAARIIRQAFTEPRTRVLVVAPYLIQIQTIFSDMGNLLNNSPLEDSITRNVKQPTHEINVSNGSIIRGMCAGATPGRRGSSLRSQGAKYIYVDEFDYMDEESLTALLMITKTEADTELFVTGTPSGVRSWFYKWCMEPEKHGFITRHYSKEHIPNWTDTDDKQVREIYSKSKYDREVLAEFSDEVSQVFATAFIDASLYEYDPNTLVYNPKNKYGIGVDWNSAKTGCQICVLEHVSDTKETESDKKFLESVNKWRAQKNSELHEKAFEKLTWESVQNKLRVFRLISVASQPFTQHEAVERIIDTYHRYNPLFLWVDQGYGEAQVEIMMKWALDHKDKRLPAILKACSFASTIEVKDPISKVISKKRFKPYMVGVAQRYLEALDFILPISQDTGSTEEDTTQGLVVQMREYTVEKFTVAKEPVYSSGNDHVLDAFMLSLLGFDYLYGPITSKRIEEMYVRVIPAMPIQKVIDARTENPALVKDEDTPYKKVQDKESFFRDTDDVVEKKVVDIRKINFRVPVALRRWTP